MTPTPHQKHVMLYYCLSEYYTDKENARWHMLLWFSGEVRVPSIQKT